MGARQSRPSNAYPVYRRRLFRDNTGVVITMIVLVILAIVIGIIVYIARRKPSTTLVGECEPGLCKYSKTSGVKTCPTSSTTTVTYDLALEGCTSGNYCQEKSNPCARLPGGTLDCFGRCNLPGSGGTGNNRCNCLPPP